MLFYGYFLPVAIFLEQQCFYRLMNEILDLLLLFLIFHVPNVGPGETEGAAALPLPGVQGKLCSYTQNIPTIRLYCSPVVEHSRFFLEEFSFSLAMV